MDWSKILDEVNYSPERLAGFTSEDMRSCLERLHNVRDQTISKIFGWLVIGNGAAFAYCVPHILTKGEGQYWQAAIMSVWCFLGGLILAVLSAFYFAKSQNEFAQHAQLLMLSLRSPEGNTHLDEIANNFQIKGYKSAKVIGWTMTISAGCFVVGTAGALLTIGRIVAS